METQSQQTPSNHGENRRTRGKHPGKGKQIPLHKVQQTMQKRAKFHRMRHMQKMDSPKMHKPHNGTIHRPLQRRRGKLGMQHMQTTTNNPTTKRNQTTLHNNQDVSQHPRGMEHTTITTKNPEREKNYETAETSGQADTSDTSSSHLNESGEATKTKRPSQPLKKMGQDTDSTNRGLTPLLHTVTDMFLVSGLLCNAKLKVCFNTV